MPIRRAVGVLGRAERAEVDERGAVFGVGATWRLDWWVADAEGRWRDPSTDPTVRQVAIESAPVFETAMRVPGGDVRQRVYAAAESGTWVVVELVNDSSQPVAVALAMEGHGPALVSPRPAPAVAAPVGAPRGAVVFPVAHQATVRVALPLRAGESTWPDHLPAAVQVVAGWERIGEDAERLEAPGTLPGQLALARSQLLLTDVADRTLDPAVFLLAAGARWRLARHSIDVTTEEVGVAAQRVARRVRDGVTTRDYGALVEAHALLDAAGDHRGAGDADRILDRLSVPLAVLPEAERDGDCLSAMRAMVAATDPSRARTLVLLPRAPVEWEGSDIAAHHIPTRWGEISFAVRWHGPRPALLWDLDPPPGQPVTLRAPVLDATWSAGTPRGETLLSGISAT